MGVSDIVASVERVSQYWATGRHVFPNWDAVRDTSECRHCQGSGLVDPSDPWNECGFCDDGERERLRVEREG